jgi:hypothetical protein
MRENSQKKDWDNASSYYKTLTRHPTPLNHAKRFGVRQRSGALECMPTEHRTSNTELPTSNISPHPGNQTAL